MRKGKKPQKNKQPGKSQGPVENKDSGSEEEFERQTQEDAELVPPARRPPTAVGAGTPPLPPRPSGPSRSTPEPHRRPALFRLLQTVRLRWQRCSTWRMLLSTPSRRACSVGPECAAGLTSA